MFEFAKRMIAAIGGATGGLVGYNAMKIASLANQEYKVRTQAVTININEKMV